MSVRSSVGHFFAELRDRKVLRVALGYLVVGWLVLQVGDVFIDNMALPEWSFRLLLVLLSLGFPVALVMAWVLDWTPHGIRRELPKATPVAHAASIAVLPFDDLSEAHDQGYFCEGIAQEVLNVLCRIEGLHVASQVLSFGFAGESTNVEVVGSKLNVETVLRGSVRKSGDLLRITAQLIRARDGYHLWSQQFDRKLEDVFEIQAQIAEAIARTLKLTLARRSSDQELHTDPLAYDFFLRGLAQFVQQGAEANTCAREMFRCSIEMDPNYARAWAGLAYTYGFEYLYFQRREELREMARRTSAKALSLSPQLVESHIARAVAHMISEEFAQADAEFECAIRMDPNNFEAWYLYARCKVHEGELRRAIELFDNAAKVRPDDFQSLLLPAQLHISLGDAKGAQKKLESAMEKIHVVLEIRPDDVRARNLGAFALVRLGRREEGLAWLARSLEIAPNDPIVRYNAACLHAIVGNADEALRYLKASADSGGLNREWLLHDSDLDSLRERPEFRAIVNAGVAA